MGVNKVIYYGEVLVDMSQVTVNPETLAKGETALDASGELITGLHECKETEPKLQSKTVTPTTSLQTVNPDSGYDGLSKVTVNAMPTATQATPSITVSSSGLITAKATQSAGYVASGTKQATKQLTTQAAQTITPSTSNKTIASGRYLTGTQTIKGDANLVAGNIKKGVSIFGVSGSYEGGVTPTGTLDITANGKYDVTQYASANVNVPSSGGGGTSVDTCTLTIQNNSSSHFDVYATAYDSEQGFSTCIEMAGTDGERSIDSAVCGSAVLIVENNLQAWNVGQLDGVWISGGYMGVVRCFEIDKDATSATITISGGGGDMPDVPEPI